MQIFHQVLMTKKTREYTVKVTYENSNELFFNFSPLNGGRYCEGESMKFRTCNVKVKNWLGYVSASLPTD